MSAIGILGGMGPQASARLYELLIDGTKAYTPAVVDEDYPEIVLLNVPAPDFITNKERLQDAKQILIDSAKLLERAGCVVNGIACNTAHILLPELQAATSVPFLSIPNLVAAKAKSTGLKRLGLLATPTTLSSTLYDEALEGAAELVRPDPASAQQTARFIYKLINNTLSSKDQKNFRQMSQRFIQEAQLDAVILGCTELPLIYETTIDTKIIDTLQLLGDALLQKYFTK